jgi:hypothetical protein
MNAVTKTIKAGIRRTFRVQRKVSKKSKAKLRSASPAAEHCLPTDQDLRAKKAVAIHDIVKGTPCKRQAEQKEHEAERRKLVAKGVRIIGVDSADRQIIERSIRFVQGMTAHLEGEARVRPHSKKEKAVSARLEKALRRLQVALGYDRESGELTKELHLPKFVRDYFPSKEIEQWRSYCARHAKVALDKPRRRDAAARRIAADEAALLLKHYGLPVSGKKHERLTAVLLGDPLAKLSYASRLTKVRNQV